MSQKQKTQKAQKAPKQKKVSSGPKPPKSRGNSAASRKIVVLIIILLIAAAAVFLFSKLGGCALFKSLKEYKDAYDEISGSDTQVISSDVDYGTFTPEEEQPKVDNSSDASIFDILTGCGGKAAENNTDQNAGSRLGNTSPTDAAVSYHWEQPESDEAYNRMMKDKENEFITLFTQLDDMRGELSDCRNTAQVENNDRFVMLRAKLLGWCNGAQSFSAAALGENSQRASELASRIASDTRDYLDLYPRYVCSPDGVKEKAEELSNSIIDAMLQLDEIIG